MILTIRTHSHKRATQKPNSILSATATATITTTTASTGMATAAEPELKTYWCHECDMSVSLTSPSPSPSPSLSPLLCPHCHTHFLELMDSPFLQNDAAPFPFPSLFDPHNGVVSLEEEEGEEDPLLLALLSPPKTTPPKPPSLPAISVTPSLLSQLDPNGVVLCAVCKDEIAVDSEAKHLPCNHLYHSECITPWLELHSSCPLCRFRLSEEEGEEGGGGGDLRAGDIRRQLRAAMVRLSELMEEEEDDFYGLRTTLNHIASRHGLINPSGEDGGFITGLRLPDDR